MDSFGIQLCDIQGRLFERAFSGGYQCPFFIESFMLSDVAAHLDLSYDRYQWAGEEYLLEEIVDEVRALPKISGTEVSIYNQESMYWVGYLYRYWSLLTGESSREIYKQADASTAAACYAGFHVLDPQQAIDNFKEIFNLKSPPHPPDQTTPL